MICFKCKIEKETREFQENEFLTRGYVDNCFECESVYFKLLAEDSQRNKSRADALQLEKDKANEYRKTYRLKNKDIINEKARLYRQANKVVKVIDPKEITYKEVIDNYKEYRRSLRN